MSKNDIILSFSRIKRKKENMKEEVAEKWILYYLLNKTYGKMNFVISGKGKKVKGYGLKQDEFDLKSNKSKIFPKIPSWRFKQRKKRLLEHHLIEEHKHKRYMITSLGIARLGELIEFEEFHHDMVINILRFCKLYGIKNVELIPYTKIKNAFTKKQSIIEMGYALESIKSGHPFVNINYVISDVMKARLFFLTIQKKKIEILQDYRGEVLKFTKNSLEGKKISKNEFFSLVAETILGNYYASLYESAITGIIRKPKIKKQLKALGKKNISYAKKFLNNIEHMIRTEHEHYQYCTKFPVESYTKLS